ncbi:lycopene cyclase family protein [Roseivirga sp. E12]|uniref:lycopene cyclase family protein n=1 Tax=Roseivirga sp. E12 TaxID=2819237 RepID=UPI001ABCB6FC|nr:lycopene cyclase family protein [Roseivirga sp. E12]MBO3698450.1 lycopene cyclase [Roseivirga sp. E12]
MKQYDYIVAGAGAAGLTLAYVSKNKQNFDKSILIIDREDKSKNDRTWCFWEKNENLFEHLVHKSWKHASFFGTGFNETYEIDPYSYKLIQGIDFYEYIKKSLSQDDRITWVKEEIQSIESSGKVITDQNEYLGSIVFDSTFNHQELQQKPVTTLLQHFKGYFITSESPAFNPDACTYMDFSIDQEGDCRFGYVLPFDAHNALVEYTVFSKSLLKEDQYTDRLETYVKRLGITNYKVKEEEFGVIPMTDYSFQMRVSENVIRIGINGGFAKPSTGYTFLRGQKIITKMVDNLSKGIDPLKDLPFQKARFKKYDATLLNVLASGKYTGDEVFTPMFKKNGAKAFFKFLDEETSLKEELKIMSSTPILDFGTAFIKSMLK